MKIFVKSQPIYESSPTFSGFLNKKAFYNFVLQLNSGTDFPCNPYDSIDKISFFLPSHIRRCDKSDVPFSERHFLYNEYYKLGYYH